MTGKNKGKIQLSKSILEMKFMKKTKEKVEKEIYQEQGEEYFGNQLTTKMKKESENYITEPSFVFCEGLIDGRVSFGMNPEIEKLMELERHAKLPKVNVKEEADISQEQMADHYKSSSLISSMAKKFQPKRSRSKVFRRGDVTPSPQKKKHKFLKPSD